jgi:hypothetical protein
VQSFSFFFKISDQEIFLRQLRRLSRSQPENEICPRALKWVNEKRITVGTRIKGTPLIGLVRLYPVIGTVFGKLPAETCNLMHMVCETFNTRNLSIYSAASSTGGVPFIRVHSVGICC